MQAEAGRSKAATGEVDWRGKEKTELVEGHYVRIGPERLWIDDALKKLGDDGWELVAAFVGSASASSVDQYLYFKRPKV